MSQSTSTDSAAPVADSTTTNALVEEIKSLEKTYIENLQQVEDLNRKQLETLKALLPKQNGLLSGIINNQQEKLKEQEKEIADAKSTIVGLKEQVSSLKIRAARAEP